MTPDTLDQMTDAQLDELFAVEVARWQRANPEEKREHYQHWIPPGKPKLKGVVYSSRPAAFTTDANAVLPWLEKCGARVIIGKPCSVDVFEPVPADGQVYAVGVMGRSHAPTFPRAAVIALIRARRAGKSGT